MGIVVIAYREGDEYGYDFFIVTGSEYSRSKSA